MDKIFRIETNLTGNGLNDKDIKKINDFLEEEDDFQVTKIRDTKNGEVLVVVSDNF